jgi:ligand-binding sensor domain-containing protein/signal transduction histidine kinase
MSKNSRWAAAKVVFPLRSFLCLLSILIFLTSAIAERLPVKTYTVADGLLRDTVYKIKQDSRGFLWLCTVDGLSRFDGYAFKNFTVDDGLPDRHVNDVLETKDGNIWVATEKGIARLNPTGLSGSTENPLFTVFIPGGLASKSVQVLFADEGGTMWAGTGDGLYKFDTQLQFEKVDLGSTPISVSSIMKDRRGDMWLGTSDGLRRIEPNGQVKRLSLESGLPGTRVSTVYEDKGGRIWVGFRAGLGAGLVLLVPEPAKAQNIVERHFTGKNGLPSVWITDLRETSDGKFWVGTTSGLCEWQTGDDPVCKTYTEKNELCDREVWSITEDKDNNLWIGSRCGAKKWARYGFTSYNEADGLGYTLADSIFENQSGDLFVSFNKGDIRTLSRFDGEGFKLVKPNFPAGLNYFGWGWNQTVREDRDGSWLFPTGSGLFSFPGAKTFEDLALIMPQKIELATKDPEIFRTFEDSSGDLWVATIGNANELWRRDRASKTWYNVTLAAGLGPERTATAFVEDHTGNLWIGTGSDSNNTGLIRYRGSEFTVFAQNEYALLDGWLRDLLVDGEGRLWIASSNSGLLRVDDLSGSQLDLRRYATAEGLSSTGVGCVTEDEFGRIYVGTGRGLDRLDPETGRVENFTTADGLPNSYIEVAFRDRTNALWFGTANGLARFVPEPETNRQPANVLLTGLRVNGEPRSISIMGESSIPELDLDSSQRQVTVDFLGLGASLGEKLKYEYRLNGSEWTATLERTLNFANLDSASYTFEVRAITAERIYSQPATLAFRVASPLWQRSWFIAAILAITAFLIYAFYRYRLGKLLELERVRTRIATDLHDDIGANLTRIALMSEVANQQVNFATARDGSPGLMSSIADIARESVASMNDIVWAISPEHDSLIDLTRRMRRHADEVFTLRDIDLDFQAPSPDSELRLSVGVRRDLLLIFKEAVSNAAKHSLCSRVVIQFICEDSMLKLRVSDNGRGFDTAVHGDGNGLDSMTRRAAALGGSLVINSGELGTVIEVETRLLKISQN